jgi:uncharacterized protein (TIGR03435 family)
MTTRIVTAAILLMAFCCFAQSGFEVATVKLSPPPPGDLIQIDLGTFRNGRLTLTNVTLKDAIKYAHAISSDEQLTAPDWNNTIRFDIVALADPGTPREKLQEMTRKLLAERLGLTLRRDQRPIRHLALTAPDPKLPPAKPEAEATPPGTQVRGRISHNRMPMQQLAALLSRFERQTVVDATGLRGFFEVKLDWAPDNSIAANDDRPSLFAAVKDELGLKLESRRAPLEVLVVESCSKVPAEN